MGREIRRVPENWEHPKDSQGHYIPLYDREYEPTAREYLNDCIAWGNGTHPDLVKHPEYKKEYPYFWMYSGGPPNAESYRPRFENDATWLQVYETVSEGTPVTPPFSSKQELIDYLVQYGDFWDQHRGDGGWTRKNAERFVESEYAPSMVVYADKAGISILSPRDGA